MNHLERFLATVERKAVDHPAAWLGLPAREAIPRLLAYFRVRDLAGLKKAINDDIWPVEVPYHCPPANHIACAFDFFKDKTGYEERTLTAPGYFEGVDEIEQIADFPWPDPAEHMNAALCRQAVAAAPAGYAAMGIMWSAHFQDACAAFGMETALVRMLEAPALFQAVIDRITDFYLRANRIFYEACGDRLHAVLIGNDFGSQTALMVSPGLLRRFVFPGTKKLIAQAKACGYKVIHHSCGAVWDIIPDLIAMGADVIHPIQSLAAGMDPIELKKYYGNQVSFCGGVDAQNLLPHGAPREIRSRVAELIELFPTGLVVSPSHEAILPDIPPENIQAMFNFNAGFIP